MAVLVWTSPIITNKAMAPKLDDKNVFSRPAETTSVSTLGVEKYWSQKTLSPLAFVGELCVIGGQPNAALEWWAQEDEQTIKALKKKNKVDNYRM